MAVTKERIGNMLSEWKRCLSQCEDYVETLGGTCIVSDELHEDYPDFRERWARVEKERDRILAELNNYRLEKELEPVCCSPEDYFLSYYNTPVSIDTVEDILIEIEEREKDARYEESLYLYD